MAESVRFYDSNGTLRYTLMCNGIYGVKYAQKRSTLEESILIVRPAVQLDTQAKELFDMILEYRTGVLRYFATDTEIATFEVKETSNCYYTVEYRQQAEVNPCTSLALYNRDLEV